MMESNNDDILGTMIISEDGIITNSTGELSNDEALADAFFKLINTSVAFHLSDPLLKQQPFNKLSVYWESYVYCLTASNRKIHVIKKVKMDDLNQ